MSTSAIDGWFLPELTPRIFLPGEPARLKAAFYLPSMPPALLERHGVPIRMAEPIGAAFARGDVAAALRLTPDDLVDVQSPTARRPSQRPTIA